MLLYTLRRLYSCFIDEFSEAENLNSFKEKAMCQDKKGFVIGYKNKNKNMLKTFWALKASE